MKVGDLIRVSEVNVWPWVGLAVAINRMGAFSCVL